MQQIDDELLIRLAATGALLDAGCDEAALELTAGAVAQHLEVVDGEVVAIDSSGKPMYGLFGRLGAKDVVELLRRRDAAERFGWSWR